MTKNFEMFKEETWTMKEAKDKLVFINDIGGFSGFNRNCNAVDEKTDNPHVRELALQIEKDGGLTRRVLVIKTRSFGGGIRYVIADGQHLFRALILLRNKTVPILIIEIEGLIDIWQRIVSWNNTQLPWYDIQYVKSGAACKLKDYANLLYRIVTEYPVIHLSIQCGEFMQMGRGRATKLMKSGKFQIDHVAEATVMERFEAVTVGARALTRDGRKPTRALVEALVKLTHKDKFSYLAFGRMIEDITAEDSCYNIPAGDYNDILESLTPHYNVALKKTG